MNEFIIINISNPVYTTPKRNGRLFKTSKQGHSGIGLSNVVKSVEKYNGHLICETENNCFIVNIVIPIKA